MSARIKAACKRHCESESTTTAMTTMKNEMRVESVLIKFWTTQIVVAVDGWRCACVYCLHWNPQTMNILSSFFISSAWLDELSGEPFAWRLAVLFQKLNHFHISLSIRNPQILFALVHIHRAECLFSRFDSNICSGHVKIKIFMNNISSQRHGEIEERTIVQEFRDFVRSRFSH